MNCKGCGKCCKLSHPYLDVEIFEDKIPSKYLEFKKNSFYMKRKENGDCIALENNLCSIYDSRPKECREFNQNHPLCKILLEAK